MLMYLAYTALFWEAFSFALDSSLAGWISLLKNAHVPAVHCAVSVTLRLSSRFWIAVL